MSDLTRVDDSFELDAVDAASTPGFIGDKTAGEAALKAGRKALVELQAKLFAASKFDDKRSVLLVLQAMDTAGKGGILDHVLGGANPQGVLIHSFKAPTDEEKKHDFLWRIRRELPPPGYIGVFDRSHYEDVLIHRVRQFSTPEQIEERYGLIAAFEQELVASGTTIIKVMLHISRDEQRERLEARLTDPTKQWKFNPGDIDERALWDSYQEAYQIALTRTSTVDAPWFVVPADRKWFARLAVQRLLLDALRGLNLEWPTPEYDPAEQLARLAAE